MKILLVEDEKRMAQALCQILRLENYEVDHCADGLSGLEAIERTVIDRAVQRIYQPYFADPCPENMPILSDLHDALTAQHLPEADRVAQALDLYVSGSLNFFNHRTTVDINNRLSAMTLRNYRRI